MAYLALYREWRPKLFKEVVGQEHITKTLTNAFKQDKIAHAYLFSGPRGTGKTTVAKIMAKALNCEGRNGEEPCNSCASCLSIDQGSAIEVFEIDAASNRGINEIRDLRENIKLSTSRGKYKVYIIDEVHMLTTEAFNALLKTLEEPPSQVVFILATTEAQKIPLTILSRVQRFEFHRISVKEIKSRLEVVCQSLHRQVDSNALEVIAQKSEGGLRDALSILDQCLLNDDTIGIKEVYDVLGMVGETYSFQLVNEIILSDYSKCLTLFSDAVQKGRDPRQIIRELLEYLRQMLLTIAMGEAPSVDSDSRERMIEQSKQAGMSRVLRWISILLQGEAQLRFASNARLAAELLLVQTIHDSGPSNVNNQGEVLSRLTTLEQQIQHLSATGTKSLENKTKTSKPVQHHTQKCSDKKPGLAEVKPPEHKTSSEKSRLSIEVIQERWDDVMEQIKKRKKSTQAFLLEGKPFRLVGDTLVVLFREGCSFHKDKVNQTENRKTIEEVLKLEFGSALKLQNFMEDEYKEEEKPEIGEANDENQDLINKTKSIFGEELVTIKE